MLLEAPFSETVSRFTSAQHHNAKGAKHFDVGFDVFNRFDVSGRKSACSVEIQHILTFRSYKLARTPALEISSKQIESN